jgi:uncharacterized protein YutE (UPF0331/DUF86 family)
VDRAVVEQKLETLRRCVKRLQTKCPPAADSLVQDLDLQDIVSFNLSRAVQLCVDIGAHLIAGMDVPPPDTMGQTFDILAQAHVHSPELALRLKKAVGFRNMAVHNYKAIDWHMVHSLATSHLDDFSAFAKVVSIRLDTP